MLLCQNVIIYHSRLIIRSRKSKRLISRCMECQLATLVDGQGTITIYADGHILERQRRVTGGGGDNEWDIGRSYALRHLNRAGETDPHSIFSYFITPFVVGAREEKGGTTSRKFQRSNLSQIVGRLHVGSGLAGNGFTVSGRQAVSAEGGDSFQLREHTGLLIGADGGEGFVITISYPRRDRVGNLDEVEVGAVYRIGGDVGGWGGGIFSYRQLDLGAGIIVGKDIIIITTSTILSDNAAGNT